MTLGPGDVIRYPTDTGLDTYWKHFEVELIRIPLTAVARVAYADTGVADVRFDAMTPVSAPMARQWRGLSRFVHQTLNESGSMADSPLVNMRLIELIAATALIVFLNTTMRQGRVSGPGRMPPAALRRAAAYIDAHAAEPVTLAGIATAAGTTVRAVQAAFQRHYGMTPTGYLRRVRLEGAHRDPRSAEPDCGETVAATTCSDPSPTCATA